MSRCVLSDISEANRSLRRAAVCLGVVAVLAGCGTSRPTQHAAETHHQYAPRRYYPPPGPDSDPWGPYIREASSKFSMPEHWVRAVMRQESGGQEDVISWAGAMGLMQVMPDTYDELRGRYAELGEDPFDPHNNILAGTAYLREMYDRYGSPGFLAAYNAGPNRVDRFLASRARLPDETIHYVASIAPRLGPDAPMSGPVAVYAGVRRRNGIQLAAARVTSSGCDPDAAYNPDVPCGRAQPAVSPQPAVLQTARAPTPGYCDQDAAYDPSQPCQRREERVQEAMLAPPPPPAASYEPPAYQPPSYQPPAYQPPSYQPSLVARPMPTPYAAPGTRRTRPMVLAVLPPPPPASPPALPHAHGHRPIQEAMTREVAFHPAAPPLPAQWGIQVGAFPTLGAAVAAADHARSLAPDILRMTKTVLPPTAPLGTQVAFRARIVGLTQTAAADACTRLGNKGLPCMTVPPSQF